MNSAASLDAIVAYLDRLLDIERFRASEPEGNGLLLRAGPDVVKVALAVNTSLATIKRAAEAGVQLLIAHHPPWPTIDLDQYAPRLAALNAADISLYGAHAALDCAPHIGTSWRLAELLGVEVESTFSQYHGGNAGVIGRSRGSLADLAERAGAALGRGIETHEHNAVFGLVAVLAGAGGDTSDLHEARRLGCDTYVTGEGSMYTRLFAREAGLNLLFGSHHSTEAPGVRALGERLTADLLIPHEFLADLSDVL